MDYDQEFYSSIHMYSDSGRFDHCWESLSASHVFQYPGEYQMEFHGLGPGGIQVDSIDAVRLFTVIGSKADIDYVIKCGSSYTIDLDASSSINADTYAWVLDDVVISREKTYTHTFDETGEYRIFLFTEDSSTNCPAAVDSTDVFITDVKADFEIPDKLCADTAYNLDASKSVDAHDSCYEGYLWNFDTSRPREVGEPILEHSFPAGKQTIRLTVEDVNGCKDVIEKTVDVYGMEPDFELDTLFCLPNETQIFDESVADTTLVAWDWSFGSSDNNPTYTFTEADIDTLVTLPDSTEVDGILVQLQLTDALGCVDSIEYVAQLYEPVTEITLDNGPKICVDEIINFSAEDFTEQGSFLQFEWDYVNGVSTEQNAEIVFTEAGEIPVTLTFTEASSGCQNTLDTLISVFDIPIASFTTPFDSVEFICYPQQIDFTNTSFEDGPVLYSWDFGNGSTSSLEDPLIAYEKGTYTATFIVRSFYGCRDTFTQTFTLVGPEGDFVVDQDMICPGEEVTFTLVDTVDVTSWVWDFGDGTVVTDQSPVTHIFEPVSDTTTFNPTLTVMSEGGGDCDVSTDLDIGLSAINAFFGIDTSGLCPGDVQFLNQSPVGNVFNWTIETSEGTFNSDEENPFFELPPGEIISVSFMVEDADGCEASFTDSFELAGDRESYRIPNVFSPNADQRNDYFNVFIAPGSEDKVSVKDFKIYNRWGNLIYDNDSPSTGWNGAFNNKILEPETFAYYIEIELEGCKNVSKKGNVTIIK